MTQRAKVLKMLRDAGSDGVRSDAFYADYLPRAGARIHELRSEGYNITSEHEKQFVRYRLHEEGVGPSAAERVVVARAADERGTGLCGDASRQKASAGSGVPSMFDFDADWSAAA